jgi:hypothetical protein
MAMPALADTGTRVIVEREILVHGHGHGKPGAGDKARGKDGDDCCAHGRKADCDDKECRDRGGKDACGDDCKDDCDHHRGGKDACGDDCKDGCDHHGGGHMGGHMGTYRQRMMMHHMARSAAFDIGLGQQWNTPTGRAYTMVTWDKLVGRPGHQMWWNPKMGMGGAYGMDLGDQTNTRHLGYMGWVAQNTFRFGAFHVTAGVLLGGGLNLDITPTLGFQNYNGFFAADPRLSLGWQVTPRMSVNLAGNYLFTTRPAAVGGPGAGLSLSYGF